MSPNAGGQSLNREIYESNFISYLFLVFGLMILVMGFFVLLNVPTAEAYLSEDSKDLVKPFGAVATFAGAICAFAGISGIVKPNVILKATVDGVEFSGELMTALKIPWDSINEVRAGNHSFSLKTGNLMTSRPKKEFESLIFLMNEKTFSHSGLLWTTENVHLELFNTDGSIAEQGTTVDAIAISAGFQENCVDIAQVLNSCHPRTKLGSA